MGKVFLSYSNKDGALARQLAEGLTGAGLATWYYDADSVPGVTYLRQINEAIGQCRAIILLISEASLASTQVSKEVFLGHECGKPFIPLLIGVSHAEFQKRQPEWRTALGAHTSIELPPEGIGKILPRILDGLRQLGVAPTGPVPVARPVNAGPVPKTADAEWQEVGPFAVKLAATFDRDDYPADSDPLAHLLVEATVRRRPGVAAPEIPADIALILDLSGSMRRENRYDLLCEAVREFARQVGAKDRAAVVIFSNDAEVVSGFVPGAELERGVEKLLGRVARSPVRFGPKTNLLPALEKVVGLFRAAGPGRDAVKRVYVLTDGRLHDPRECLALLPEVRKLRAEIGVYGFGTEVNPAALKRLLAGQHGGWVKPIVNKPEIVANFAHIAAVNRALVGQEGRIVVEFADPITLGSAWAFRPFERHFGTVTKRRNSCDLGPPEAERTYSLLFEVRLPPDAGPQTRVGKVGLIWRNGTQYFEHRLTVQAERNPTPLGIFELDTGAADNRAWQAFLVLDGLRRELDLAERLEAERASLEIAKYENRPAELIQTIAKKIGQLECELGLRAAAEASEFELSAEEEMLDEADWASDIVGLDPEDLAADESDAAEEGDDEEIRLVALDEEFGLELDDDFEDEAKG